MSETNKQQNPKASSSSDKYRGVDKPVRYVIENGQIVDRKTGKHLWQIDLVQLLNEYENQS